jgi:hypothetical protein
MLLFVWKTAVFSDRAAALFAVAVAVIVGHVMLRFGRFSRRLRGLLSVIATAIFAGGCWFFSVFRLVQSFSIEQT